MLRRISTWLVLCSIVLLSSAPLPITHASVSTVRVTVSDDPVRINGQLMDNALAKYPFLTYKGITYLPLTWDNATALGIQLMWNTESGLQIYKQTNYVQGSFPGGMRPPLQQDISAQRPLPISYTAALSNYPISIAYQTVDNSQEEYPFLEFQDITYMPLTWHFVHDLLKLTIYWDAMNGLNVIGGQRQIFGQLLWDDAYDVYIQPGIRVDDEHVMLKMSKSLTETPIWMNKSEAEQIQDQMKLTRENDPYRGKAVNPDIREDGLYYEGQKLLEASELDDPSKTTTVQFGATRFDLSGNRYLLSVAKRNMTAGRSFYTYHLFLFTDGKAAELSGQPAAKVIPIQGGGYWIASYPEFGRSIRPQQLARLDSEGHYESLNVRWNELSLAMLGLGSPNTEFGEPGFTDPQTADGHIYVQLMGYSLQREQPQFTPGIYMVDPQLKLTKVTSGAALGMSDSRQYYVSSDMQLYALEQDLNKIYNLTTEQAALWYDYELVKPE